MDEELFQKVCNAAGVKALEMMQSEKKMRRDEMAFCRAVIELMKKVWEMDLEHLKRL